MSKSTIFVFIVAFIFVGSGYLMNNYALIALGLSTAVMQAAISINGSD